MHISSNLLYLIVKLYAVTAYLKQLWQIRNVIYEDFWKWKCQNPILVGSL